MEDVLYCIAMRWCAIAADTVIKSIRPQHEPFRGVARVLTPKRARYATGSVTFTQQQLLASSVKLLHKQALHKAVNAHSTHNI